MQLSRYSLFLVLALCASTVVFGSNSNLIWDERVVRGQLENGLNYYLFNSEKESDPFNIRLIVHAGSVDENEVKGIAHAVEHMVFNQTKNHPETVQMYLRSIGWQTGRQVNALTRPTETQFMVRTRPDDALNLNESLDLLADMVGQARFTQEQWQLEQQIIIEEKRVGDSVASRINESIKQATKANSKYAEGSVIGSYESIQSITLQELTDFYRSNYIASNMSLIVSGYFEPESAQQAIENAFGAMPTLEKPARDYVNFPLDSNTKLFAVQDAEGTSSKVALGFRLPLPTKDTVQGAQVRVENYLLRKMILAQVRRNNHYLPDSVDALSGVLQEPANERMTLAFSARTKDHDLGLKVILTELERLFQFGLDANEFSSVMERARATAARGVSAANSRDYQRWEDKITEAVLTQGVVQEPVEKEAMTQELLDAVTFERLNERLRSLLSAQDIFVYYQAPGAVELSLPSSEQVDRWREEARNSELLTSVAFTAEVQSDAKTAAPVSIALPYQKPSTTLSVSPAKVFEQEGVMEWTLANGSRVVWLNRPTASNEIYFRVVTDVGSMTQEYPDWLASAAIQLYEQLPPTGVDNDVWQQWQSLNEVQWQYKLGEYHFDLSLAAPVNRLEEALFAFWLHHQPRIFSADAVTAAKESAAGLLGAYSPGSLTDLRLGEGVYQVPNEDEIAALDEARLAAASHRIVTQPFDFFIVGELDPETIQHLSGQYLATINTEATLNSRIVMQRNGVHHFVREKEGALQTQTVIYGRTPMAWSPERAFLLSTLNPITQQALSRKLRLEMAGVYRVEFEMSLNPDLGQVESQLSFISSPDRAEELASAAKRVLSDLTSAIEAANLDQIKADIEFAEQGRLTSSSTWLRRLMLSYRKYSDPRYLNTMQNMQALVTRENLLDLSKQVLPMKNQVQVTTLYRPDD